MRIKKERVCPACSKVHLSLQRLCGGCAKRMWRRGLANKGKGCRFCGGPCHAKNGICRQCFWELFRKAVENKEKSGNPIVVSGMLDDIPKLYGVG
jgi:hypothetical protein